MTRNFPATDDSISKSRTMNLFRYKRNTDSKLNQLAKNKHMINQIL